MNRRDLFKRGIGLIGLAAMTQKLPRAVAEVGGMALPVDPRWPSLTIANCHFLQGDPEDNAPDMIEEWTQGLVIRDQPIFIRDRLTLTGTTRLLIIDSSFDDVPLHLVGATDALINGTRHVNRSHDLSIHVDAASERITLLDVMTFSEPGAWPSMVNIRG